MGLADAAAIPEVFLTAWDALVVQGGLTSGRWALVHAGASGVGTAAIQIAKAIGGRIAVTCSAGKVEACRALGADVVIDYGSQDFVAEVRRATGGDGVDVVLDVIGGDYVDRNLQSVADRRPHRPGRPHGRGSDDRQRRRAAAEAGQPRSARCCGRGRSRRRSRSPGGSPPRCCRCSTTGRSRPVIDSRYPLDEIADAHAHMESNANIGKILIDVA